MTIIGIILNMSRPRQIIGEFSSTLHQNKLQQLKPQCASINVRTYKQFKQQLARYDTAVVVAQLTSTKQSLLEQYQYITPKMDTFLFIDMHKLLTEQPVSLDLQCNTVTNWIELEKYLNGLEKNILPKYCTRTLVPQLWCTEIDHYNRTSKYEPTPFHSNITTEFKIRSVENTFGLTVEYGDHDPHNRYTRGQHWSYPDLVIRDDAADGTIDLTNSLPIINGSVFYPETWINIESNKLEMFAHKATKWIINSSWNHRYTRTTPHTHIYDKSSQTIVEDIYSGNDLPKNKAHCYNKNILLMDFSPFGSMSTIKLSDCIDGTIKTINTKTTNFAAKSSKDFPHTAWQKGMITHGQQSYYVITFKLPKTVEPGLPIVCLFGRMFFLNEHVTMKRVNDDNVITVTIPQDLLYTILQSNLQWFGKQIPETLFIETIPEISFDELFKDTEIGNGTPDDLRRLLYEDYSVPFVAMIHSNKNVLVTHTKPKMIIKPDKFLFPCNTGGILINKKTREIIDYTRTFYASSTLVTTTQIRPLQTLDRPMNNIVDGALSFERVNYSPRSKYMPFNPFHENRSLDQYELVDFAYRE